MSQNPEEYRPPNPPGGFTPPPGSGGYQNPPTAGYTPGPAQQGYQSPQPPYQQIQPPAPQKSFLVTWILSLLVGVFGVDRFYLGKIGTGIAKLLTFGGLGVWALVDLILVLANKQTDKYRRPLEGYDKHKVVALIVTAVFIVVSLAFNATRSASTTPAAVPVPTTSSSAKADPAAQSSATASSAPKPSSTPSAAKTTPPPAPAAPKVATQTFNGVGDDIVTASLSGEPAIVTFTCNPCSSNTVLKTNGRDSLLVNEIGSYTGSHIIDMTTGSTTSEFTINAEGTWSLTVADVSTIPTTNGPVTGHGDQVVLLGGKSTKAAITYVGERNFVVKGYGGSRTELAVNTIGSYTGTVKLTGPGFVQVTSSGDWTITPG
ncbi:TM2 domain-containing protein [Paenarthrobacter sp. NPDC089675]|uniref:TM2 domain-containing protein n=1 Tax=Paenarthrobacter sp. NPDC089675 TaxID=3364376 RepID=UPI00381A39FA